MTTDPGSEPAYDTYTGQDAGGGNVTVTVRPPYGEVWTVTQVSVEIASTTAGGSCTLRKNGYLVSPLVVGADAASGDPPVVLLPTDVLTVEWRNVTVGAVGKVSLTYLRGRA